MANAYIYIPRLKCHKYISVNEIENFDASQFDKDVTPNLMFSWRLEGTSNMENIQILSIISSEDELQEINWQKRVAETISRTLFEKHESNNAAGQVNDTNSPEKDPLAVAGHEYSGTIPERADNRCMQERPEQGRVFNDSVVNVPTAAATNTTTTPSTSSNNNVNEHDQRLYNDIEQEVCKMKQKIATLQEEVEAIKSIINGDNNTTSRYPSSFVLQNCTIHGNLTAGLVDTIVPTTAKANTVTIDTAAAKTATITNDNTNVDITANANTTNIATIDTIRPVECADETERRVEEGEEEESEDFMLECSENESVHSHPSPLSNTTENEHSDNDFIIKDKQKLLRALRKAKDQKKGSLFVTTLCNALWARRELAKRCVRQSPICKRPVLTPVKVKFIRSKFLSWIEQKDKNINKEKGAFSVYLSRAISTARKIYFPKR
ncbi:PREDICTED: uncharacterized protein LOC105450665 [Wasmannia auropunctata]|uniref:uncharacterized protein LOC105450665 n=1 Tax=Wasmannia auropunctata TaxID=64793 RepID=UPI0005EF552F|nr:PREDICTED: uncharacterized protein LOC105450665 [Wasmannia auropunctata]